MTDSIPSLDIILNRCQTSSVGKLLPNALYVHTCALASLDPILQDYERRSRVTQTTQQATLVKFSLDKPKISYLFYANFDQDPHPILLFSLVVDVKTLEYSERHYQASDNPPLLHRKETFITPDYPLYSEFDHLTRLEVKLGLLEQSRMIGTRKEWEQRLKQFNIAFVGHYLVCPIGDSSERSITIDRHKAAIVRKSLSRPVRLALESGLFIPEVTTFFDYGCGFGGDIEQISQQGYQSLGWDPYYCPNSSCIPADIVNLGYVINVIEDQQERREALIKAWELTQKVLIVSAQVLINDSNHGIVVYGDGIITRRNTFQKYYEQEELKVYIDQVLNVDSIPIALGIYFVFRDATQAETFKLSRFRSRATTPRVNLLLKRFDDYEKLLTPLMNFFTERGRLPVLGELENELEIKAEFGGFKRAFQVILQVTHPEDWEAITEKRRQDLLLNFALSKFSGRPQPKSLNLTLREDIKALFGGYQQLCMMADLMLSSLRDLEKIEALCKTISVGKKLKNSLIIHLSAVETLPTLLRLYEGCASRTFGRLNEANVIKLSFHQAKISYLYYPDFELNPHPTLQNSMEIDLRSLQVRYRDYYDDENPPILHEKDRLVTPDYPNYEKFVKLTQQEREWGLLDNFKAISHLKGWINCLDSHCAILKNYKLYWRKDADPYKVRVLRSQISQRKRKLTKDNHVQQENLD
ncbi:DNA phosphorothioation-associated methyltransferase [Aphanothece hegewaldii CCALA 016]|uniref:DNA phosphorothioation-associated methyltransferase n=1 Tax=Aphanothece hegewaldii CCALA 016 TaxID=2107694 RepID=A0A2T1M0X2_9CHRO|nr:DNA phosphorothioation-associated putative methyltransferase [Aphanothece hegewaldii]PSF38326.1 DNA phosphorothioation-associated methyltransferase [Aphanothece hegewaldii CCALA 016]